MSATTNTTIGKWGWIKYLGHNIIDKITLQIGNVNIDSIDNHWLNIWYELTKNNSQEDGYNNLIANTEYATNIQSAKGAQERQVTMYIPLHFYFTKKYNLALPLISLINDKVNLIIKLKSDKLLYNKTNHDNFIVQPSIDSMTVLTDYINLDTLEKQYFSQSPLEYLIDQVNSHYQLITSNEMNITLPFKHSVKALFWQIISGKYTSSQIFLSNDSEIATKKFILSFFNNKNNYILGSTFTHINISAEDVLFNYNTHIKNNYKNLTNSNNKNLQEIIFSAYINKTSISHDNITLDDITVPELLPIEIISLTVQEIMTELFNIDVTRHSNSEFPKADSSSEYDIIYNDFSNTGTYIDGSINPINTSLILLDGNNRFQELSGKFLIIYNHINIF